MRLELYLAETARLAQQQSALLEGAAQVLEQGRSLNALEENGTLHALQVLIENAIGKAKHLLKASGQPVPVSAYDAMQDLARLGMLDGSQLAQWNAIVGLRNRIVHDYLNIDLPRVLELVRSRAWRFVTDFLQAPLPERLRG